VTSKPGFPDLSASDPANDTPPVPVVYKRGWSTKTNKDRNKAIKDTIAEVEKLYPGRTLVGDPEIIETDEHKKANEYLVKVRIL